MSPSLVALRPPPRHALGAWQRRTPCEDHSRLPPRGNRHEFNNSARAYFLAGRPPPGHGRRSPRFVWQLAPTVLDPRGARGADDGRGTPGHARLEAPAAAHSRWRSLVDGRSSPRSASTSAPCSARAGRGRDRARASARRPGARPGLGHRLPARRRVRVGEHDRGRQPRGHGCPGGRDPGRSAARGAASATQAPAVARLSRVCSVGGRRRRGRAGGGRFGATWRTSRRQTLPGCGHEPPARGRWSAGCFRAGEGRGSWPT